jgi:hypothetical protein
MILIFYDELYALSRSKAVHTIWVLSDLQQSRPELTERCLNTAMEDYVSHLGNPAEMIWYLGDALEGDDDARLEAMTQLQIDAFADLKIPLCYACGNHDFDYAFSHRETPPRVHFAEAVRAVPGWYTSASCEDAYFRASLGSWTFFFLSDHAARDASWCVTHGRFRWGSPENYPFTQADTDRLRAEIAGCGTNVITAGHYAFLGGNRENALQSALLPMPENVRVHFYGHCHIGDAEWGGKDLFRRISWVDYHDIPQLDVSSFENIRGEACRSVLLHLYDDGGCGIFWRNHDEHRFTEAYFPADRQYPHKWPKTRVL